MTRYDYFVAALRSKMNTKVISGSLLSCVSTMLVSLGVRPPEEPIPMRLICPECGELHVDEGEFETKPHHTHACQHCGCVWRPAVVNTVGVRFLPGFKN